jgi:hypothetical protein
VLYQTHRIKLTGENTAEAYGGYYEGRLSASGNVYHLVRANGQWVVARDELRWISRIGGQQGGLRRSAATWPFQRQRQIRCNSRTTFPDAPWPLSAKTDLTNGAL